MRNFLRIAEQVDVLPLLHAITMQPHLWDAHPLRTTFPDSPHREASDILLRFNDLTGESQSFFTETETVNLPALLLLPQARPLIFDLMRRVEGERLGRVVLTKLKPGGRIYPHPDEGAYAEYYSRYHILLQNGRGSVFECGGESLFMPPGSIWWFNSRVEHSVFNGGSEDRITMIVDIRTFRSNS